MLTDTDDPKIVTKFCMVVQPELTARTPICLDHLAPTPSPKRFDTRSWRMIWSQ